VIIWTLVNVPCVSRCCNSDAVVVRTSKGGGVFRSMAGELWICVEDCDYGCEARVEIDIDVNSRGNPHAIIDCSFRSVTHPRMS
jgi:hypothetical protein